MSSSLSNVIEFPRRRDPETQNETRRVVLDERQRIARELHDVVSHGFATITINADAALLTLADEPEQALAALAAIRAASSEAMRELRMILDTLRTHEGPGLERLEALVARISAAGVPTEVCVEGRVRALPAAVELAAFRIVQEALTNVLRHAGGASARVTIRYERDALAIAIEDDGDGAKGPTSSGGGHGITGMRERVRALGGELDARPRAGGGFEVRGRLPVLGRP